MYKSGLVITPTSIMQKLSFPEAGELLLYVRDKWQCWSFSPHHQLLVERTLQGLYKQSTLIKDFIPSLAEPGGLLSMGSPRVGHD